MEVAPRLLHLLQQVPSRGGSRCFDAHELGCELFGEALELGGRSAYDVRGYGRPRCRVPSEANRNIEQLSAEPILGSGKLEDVSQR